MSRPPRRGDPFAQPADVILDALLSVTGDAYCADATSDPYRRTRWHARCPVCGGSRSLLVTEGWRGGPVSLRCAGGCHEQRVKRALIKPVEDRSAATDDPVMGGTLRLASAAVDEIAGLRGQVADLVAENIQLRAGPGRRSAR